MTKVIFLPHCLRVKGCKAELTAQGYKCVSCGSCGIAEFLKEAESKGYKVFIVPGGSMIKKILKDIPNPEKVIGVACDVELKEGHELMKKMKIKSDSLKLSKDGCVNTEVDFEKLKKML